MATVGYSGKPLWQKLGIKPAMRVRLLGAPDDYAALLGDDVPVFERVDQGAELLHAFFTERAALEAFIVAFRKSKDFGAPAWISWPKKSSKVATDITEDTIREIALPLGLVDTKVCAVSDIWSGLRLNKRVKQ
jgi:hypothetical protein